MTCWPQSTVTGSARADKPRQADIPQEIRLPTVARHMTMTRKLAMMIVIGPQGECGASSFLAIVLLEFSALT